MCTYYHKFCPYNVILNETITPILIFTILFIWPVNSNYSNIDLLIPLHILSSKWTSDPLYKISSKSIFIIFMAKL